MYTEQDRNLFFNKIKNNGQLNNNDCWEWDGQINNDNLPLFKRKSAIKIAYEMFYNNIPLTRVYRTCLNNKCVNPHHMILFSTPNYFWHFVNIKHKDECWEWVGTNIDDEGYGIIMYNGFKLPAHRLSFQLFNNIKLLPRIDSKRFICHECDNPICCNPHHLFEGTIVDNNLDKVSKNRQMKGTQYPNCKLTENDVVSIKLELQTETLSFLSKKYNVGISTISGIRNNKRWKHI